MERPHGTQRYPACRVARATVYEIKIQSDSTRKFHREELPPRLNCTAITRRVRVRVPRNPAIPDRGVVLEIPVELPPRRKRLSAF